MHYDAVRPVGYLLALTSSQPASASSEVIMWSMTGRPQELDPCSARHIGKDQTELAVVVIDQEPGRLVGLVHL